MAHKHRIVRPSRLQGSVLTESGERLTPPEDWEFLPAGDAAITRSVKAKAATWVVQIRKGRRNISKGIWAKADHIEGSRKEVEAKRATPEYARKRKTDIARRMAKQEKYLLEFCDEVIGFLDFHPRYQKEAIRIAEKITAHAAPVGSGTVARTQRIPIAKRAQAATIAWMRHQTTQYDSMKIARIKGERRAVRRELAAQSVKLLQAYRKGCAPDENCTLQKALAK